MTVIFIGILALAPTLLIFNWLIGEQEDRTKIIVTVVYLLTWALLYFNLLAVTLAQVVFCMVVGTMTFGIDWMMGR